MYDNVLFWFARQGCVGINVEYRLAPQTTYPGGAEDVASALGWVQQHGWLSPDGILIIEHGTREADLPGFSRKTFGESSLSVRMPDT